MTPVPGPALRRQVRIGERRTRSVSSQDGGDWNCLRTSDQRDVRGKPAVVRCRRRTQRGRVSSRTPERRQEDAGSSARSRHYREKIDGVIGLRTRASIRRFQRAENLPVTGQVDPQAARTLEVRPESIRSSSIGARQGIVGAQEQPGNLATRGKPWAGTRLAKGTRRPTKRLPKIVPLGADLEGSQGNREERLRTENQKQPR